MGLKDASCYGLRDESVEIYRTKRVNNIEFALCLFVCASACPSGRQKIGCLVEISIVARSLLCIRLNGHCYLYFSIFLRKKFFLLGNFVPNENKIEIDTNLMTEN